MKEKVLKDYNKEMNMLLLFNIFAFILMGFGLNYVTNYNNLVKLLVIIIIPGFPSLLITNFISAEFKEKLILNQKFKEPILTLLEKENNENIAFNLIKEEYGPYSEDYEEQHEIWYKIYRKHEYNPRVTQVHRQYLMTRDFIFIILPLMIFAILPCIFVNTISPYTIWWFILMLCEIIIFKIMANEFYNRLSINPLLEETHHLKNKYSSKDYYCFTYA